MTAVPNSVRRYAEAEGLTVDEAVAQLQKAAAARQAEQNGKSSPLAEVNLVVFAGTGVRLAELRRIGRQQTRWIADLKDDGGESFEDVRLGTTADFTNQPKFRRAVYEATGRWPHKLGGESWENVTRQLHTAAKLQEHDSGDSAQARGWIRRFARHHDLADEKANPPINVDDRDALLELLDSSWRRACFRDRQDRLYLALDELLQHVRQHVDRVKQPDLTTNLRALGFEPAQLSVRKSADRVLKGRWWRSPAGFDSEGE